MPLQKASTNLNVVLFAISGLILSFFSLHLIDVIFYTTKAFAFLRAWHVFLFIALFTTSFAFIPFAASTSERVQSQGGGRLRLKLVWFLIVWVATSLLTGGLVSVITAAIHHATLDIPSWLVPIGLFAVPIASATSVFLMAWPWRAFKSEF